MKDKLFKYSRKEEWVNVITHLAGIPLALYIFISCLIKIWPVKESKLFWSSSLFSGGLFFLLLASVLYHAAKRPSLKLFFKRLDHSAIFFFMAANYTYIILYFAEERWRLLLLILVWSLGFMGIFYKIFIKKEQLLISLISYIGFGLLFLLMKVFIAFEIGEKALFWLILGGGFYLVGTIFYALKKLPYHHGIWHLFVLAGIYSHYRTFDFSLDHMILLAN